VEAHKRNLRSYLNLLRNINNALGKRASKKHEDLIILDDDSEDELKEEPEYSDQRQFLWSLITSHRDLLKEYDEMIRKTLEKDNCLSDRAINLYLERVLQPISDSRGQNILFVRTDFYDKVKRNDGNMFDFMNRYEIELVSKYVIICHAEFHWYTIVIEYDWDSGVPKITIMDSMSTVEPKQKHASYVTKIIEGFSLFFGVEPSAWIRDVPLNNKLQQDSNNCGVWALLFAESCLKGFKSLENLVSIDIHVEKHRIAKQVESLLDWNTYHESFTKEGVIHKKRNPESDAFMPGNLKLQIICKLANNLSLFDIQ